MIYPPIDTLTRTPLANKHDSMTGNGRIRGLDLVQPTDFDILHVLKDCRRYTSPLVAEEIDSDTDYISKRMGQLAEQSVLQSEFETDRCRLYRITPYGLVAFTHKDVYERNNAEYFKESANTIAAQLSEMYGQEDKELTHTLHWHPDFIEAQHSYSYFLGEIAKKAPVGSQNLGVDGFPLEATAEQLYKMYFHGLVDRTDEGYVLSKLGETVWEIFMNQGKLDISPEDTIKFNIELTKRGFLEPPDWYEPELMVRLLLVDEPSIGIERNPVSEGYSGTR